MNHQLHREDGPAAILADGTQQWYRNGQLHREDGPAVILADGRQAWWVNGQRHREDGPAVIWTDGKQYWYRNGQHITTEVQEWMALREVTWPWDQNTWVEFVLTFS